jgi:competence transcription factor ComK
MNKNQPKRFGYLSEQVFIVEAMRKGLEVLAPVGEYLPIDFVVMNRAGKFLRTQVKATDSLITSNGCKRYAITASSGKGKTAIDCTKVDILACYVNPENQWYFIPCLSLNQNVKIWLYPQNPKSTGQWEKYKDNWEAFNTN